jgi:predicted permease
VLARARSWLRGLARRRSLEQEMADEMEFHIAARAEELARRGLFPTDALRQARVEFGGVERYKEECRESVGLRLVDELRADLVYAGRQLRRAPALSLATVSILALGIGASTALFSTVDAALLRLLPVDRPEELRRLAWTAPRPGFCRSYNGENWIGPNGEEISTSFSYPVYRHLRDRASGFADLVAFSGFERLNLTVGGVARLASGQIVSGNFFPALGTSAALGRLLSPEDDRPGGIGYPAVLSHGFWHRAYGGDRGVLGRTLHVNGTPVVVVGVLPRGSCGVDPSWCPDLMLPIAMQPAVETWGDVLAKPDYWYFQVMGRLRRGVKDEAARAEFERLVAEAIRTAAPPEVYDLPRLLLLPGAQGLEDLRNDLRRPLQILAAAVATVLLVACFNLAGLLLARVSTREREIATRLALGAGRGRIVRQLLTESLLLAALGGVAGVLLAHLAGDSIARLFLSSEQTPGVEIALNGRVLLFATGLLVAVGVGFGLAPALKATRVDLLPALRGTRGIADRAPLRSGKVLIALQVALSLALVAVSTMLVRTLVNLRGEALGFPPENLVVFQLDPSLNGYRGARLLDFHEQVVRNLEGLAGVRSASMSRHGLLTGSRTSDRVALPGQAELTADIHYVAPRSFETLGFPLLLGRDVSWGDREEAAPVVVLNATLARRLFPGRSPIGERVMISGRAAEVVGVAGDTKFDSLRAAVRPTAYVPFRQEGQYSMTFVLRSAAAPEALLPELRRAVAQVDPNVPLYRVRTQVQQIGEATRRERLLASLVGGFSLVALVLAGVGIYGTLAYQVARRTPEIGLRAALGASTRDVARLVLAEALAPVGVGIAIGLAASLLAGRVIESMLFGVTARDPVVLLVAAAFLLAGALVAAWPPARRAVRIAPMDALRQE